MPVIVELCPRTICMNAGRVIADEIDTRRPHRSRRDRGLSRRGRGMSALLRLENVSAGYVADIDILRNVNVSSRAGRRSPA